MTSTVRVLLGFAVASTSFFVSGSFQHVGAQSAGEPATTSEPNLQEPAPSSEPAPEEPALQLKLDEAGVAVVPGYPPRFDELELRVKRAKIGLGVSGGVAVAGLVLFGVGFGIAWDGGAPGAEAAAIAGGAIAIAGAIATYATLGTWIHRGRKLRRLKRELWESQYTHYGTPRRVQWDLARSRVVF